MIEKVLKSEVSKKILISTGFVVLALLLPQMFHLFGGTGQIFLPMHIPVILTGITLGPVFGLVTGIVSPVISTTLTGMPIVFPVMPIMICQLGMLGFVSGILNKYTKINSILLILLTQISGFIGYAFGYQIIQMFFLNEIQSNLSVLNAYIIGLPGVLMQLVLVTLIIEMSKRKAK